jgi:parallel beta-helix repeat protein
MKKNIILTAIILLFFSNWSNSALTYASFNKTRGDYSKSVVTSSSTLWVPDNYTNIQEAIDHAKEGETIFISAGKYYEHIIVDKALSLFGENKYDTIIDGSKSGHVVIVTADNVAISNVTIQNGDFGIWLLNSDDSILTDNIFINHTHGIDLYGSSNNILSGNFISNNYDGIYLFRSGGNILSGNFASNNYDGIHLDHSGNNLLSGSTVSNNTYGIYIHDSDNNVLSGNNALQNQCGLFFYYSSNNVVSGNTVTNNSQQRVFLDSSNNNEFFHNNFLNEIGSLRSVKSENSWDNGVEGNYWGDYPGSDANRDGVGDTPYPIGEENHDNYPLMAMFFQFNALVENRSYIINAVSDSTISDFRCYSDLENNNISVGFKVNGAGFCRISIPNALIEPPFTVRVNSSQSSYFKQVYANGTHTWLYFDYASSENEVKRAIFGLAIIIAILFPICLHYYRLFNKQKEVVEAYEREVGSFPVSHEERVRMRFVKDVIEREEKIEKFKRKYGIKIQPASTLEDLMKRLGVQKER